MNLAGSGVWFEKAIAPANWTNPSHSSMFSGLYPHQHGVTQSGYMKTRTDILKELNKYGYKLCSISSNNHFTYRTGFTDSVDEHYYTRNPILFNDGIDPFDYVSKHQLNQEYQALVELLRESIHRKNKIKNLSNVFLLVMNQLAKKYITHLQAVEHPIFNSYTNQNQQPKRDTKFLKKVISSSASDNQPYFIFNNNTHLHFPYVPSEKYQKNHLSEPIDQKELKRLNEEVAQNRSFEKLVDSGEVNNEDVRTVRKLYAASVEEVDDYLNKTIEHLENESQLTNTLLIVTADHGEDLGETDYTGRRRFGHGSSISDNVCRVPLLIFHPDINSKIVEKPFSLKQLFSIINSFAEKYGQISTSDIVKYCTEYALCEFPAAGGVNSFREKNPELREEYVRRARLTDIVALYTQDKKLIIDSEGNVDAFHQSARIDIEEIPGSIREVTSHALKELDTYAPQELSDESIKHLEEMGYI
jgi:arylsulfatase A-like enzyme